MTAHADDMADIANQPGNHGQHNRTQPKAPVPDVLDMLVEALVIRIKDKLMEEIAETIHKNLPKVQADDVEGLETYFDHAIEEYDRNNNRKIDADEVENLEDYIKETLKQATISFDF